MTAKVYVWDLEFSPRSSVGQEIPLKSWLAGKIGAHASVVDLKLSGSFSPLTSSFDPVKNLFIKPAHTSREVVSYAQAITQAIEAEQIASARSILAAIPTSLIGDPRLSSLGQALAVPVVHSTAKRDPDRSQEFNWLRTEGYKYNGQWVAIDGSQLLASAPTLRDLRTQLSKMPNQSPLIHRIV